ncbi:hypothetical protein J3F83DRAFT_623820 [Trichoderma novae-zelandiae]
MDDSVKSVHRPAQVQYWVRACTQRCRGRRECVHRYLGSTCTCTCTCTCTSLYPELPRTRQLQLPSLIGLWPIPLSRPGQRRAKDRQAQLVRIMRRLPFPPPPNLQPSQHNTHARAGKAPFPAPACCAVARHWLEAGRTCPVAGSDWLRRDGTRGNETCEYAVFCMTDQVAGTRGYSSPRARSARPGQACRVSASGRNLQPQKRPSASTPATAWQVFHRYRLACLARVASLLPPRDPTLSLSAPLLRLSAASLSTAASSQGET